ncbi:MAG: FecR domain-containing protein [Elusimicrobia bacterium]|nr:FecR domain-containing protein [Elusimicrobiota bacterium]
MIKPSSRTLSLSLLVAASLPVLALAQADADYEARLTEAKGEVTVFTAEEPEGVPGEKDMPLLPGDKVRTGEDSSAEIALSGEHCVCLRPHSELTLANLRRADSELSLALGSLLAKVQSLAGGLFRVRTPAAVAAVRGTEFAVEIDEADPELTSVGVFDEGKVSVSGADGAEELLKSNQETTVRRGSRPMPAYQLRRLIRHRAVMRSFRKRAGLMRKQWRALTPAQRQARRRELLPKLRMLRQQRLQKAQQLRDRAREKRPVRAAPRMDQQKMEQRKRAIREKLRGRGN